MSGKKLYFSENDLQQNKYYTLEGDISCAGKTYSTETWLGRGGNASVFQGVEHHSGDECAIKFLLNHRGQNAARFRREIQLLEHIKDRHIPEYFGSGIVEAIYARGKQERIIQIPFFIMELADSNLQDILEQDRNYFSYDEYAIQFLGLANALAILHKYNRAIHRDVKPQNILISEGRWLLSDFGLCSVINPDGSDDLTQDEEKLAPKYWLSPEAQNRILGCGDEILQTSDIFQMAALFWYVVTGRHPSGIVTDQDWTGPPALFPLLFDSLYHHHRKRPQTGQEFYERLEDALSQ